MNVQRRKITELMLDPANVRIHPERNLEAIKGSLARFGQQKPIVVDENNVVRAGNGTLEAARRLGWEEVDVVVSELEGPESTAYAIADNKTTDTSEWDHRALADLLRAMPEDLRLATGFEEHELSMLLAAEWQPPTVEPLPAVGTGAGASGGASGAVTITFTAEQWQAIGHLVDEKDRAASIVDLILHDEEARVE